MIRNNICIKDNMIKNILWLEASWLETYSDKRQRDQRKHWIKGNMIKYIFWFEATWSDTYYDQRQCDQRQHWIRDILWLKAVWSETTWSETYSYQRQQKKKIIRGNKKIRESKTRTKTKRDLGYTLTL